MMEGDYEIKTTDASDPSEVEAVLRGLNDYNSSVASRDWRELGVFLRSKSGDLVAGACGASVWDWVHIGQLWVHADHRKSGLGTMIVREVEAETKRRDCIGIHLDTFSFQALPFASSAETVGG